VVFPLGGTTSRTKMRFEIKQKRPRKSSVPARIGWKRIIALLCLTGLLVSGCNRSADLTSISELLDSNQESSSYKQVDIEGNFIEADSVSGVLYVQQDSLGIAVFPSTMSQRLERGDMVRVKGQVESMQQGPVVVNATIESLGGKTDTKPLAVPEIKKGPTYLNRLISVTGVVRQSDLSLGQYFEIEMGSGQGEVKAKVLDVLTSDFDLKDKKVELTGVVVADVHEEGEYRKLEMLSRGSESFTILESMTAEPIHLSISEFLTKGTDRSATSKVRLHGVLTEKNSDDFTLSDENGKISIEGILSDATQLGEEVNVVGYPPKTVSSTSWSSLMVSSSKTKQSIVGTSGLAPIRAIKKLSSVEAEAGIKVRVRGQVTFSNQNYYATIQDETAGIFVVFSEPMSLEAGQILELEGETRPGSFAPIIQVSTVKNLGASELPVPPEPSMSELNAGLYDSEWLRLKGLVISTESDAVLGDYLMLRNGKDDIKVSLPLASESSDRLIGSFVEVMGISLTVFDHTNRILGFQISSPSEDYVRILESAPKTPSNKEITPLRNLLRFENIDNSLNRVRVEGVVTSIHPSGAFFIQDSDGAALVLGQEGSEISIGENVQALGFASSQGALTTFMTTMIESLGATDLPTPVVISMMAGPEMCNDLNGKLVEVQGMLSRVSDYGENPSLQIGTNNYTMSAFFPSNMLVPELRPGSILKLRGSCETLLRTHSFVPKPLGSVLYISNESGIEVLSLPKTDFFTAYGNLFGFLVGMILLGLGWIAILRRQVHNQTEIIRRRLEIEEALKKEAQLANRTKSEFLANMSHEIRTPLTSILGFAEIIAEYEDSNSQDLAEMIGVSGKRLMRTINSVLDLASLDGKGPNLTFQSLDLVKKVRETMDSLRLEAEGKGLDFITNSSVESAMVEADESAVQRILTNLLANSIKFTDNGKVEAKVDVNEGVVILQIIDTGIGIKEEFQEIIFEAFSQESMGEGRLYEGNGLGLTIVKKLVNYMNGTIVLKSKPNEGSTFTIKFPLVTDRSGRKLSDEEEKLAWSNMDQVIKGFDLQ